MSKKSRNSLSITGLAVVCIVLLPAVGVRGQAEGDNVAKESYNLGIKAMQEGKTDEAVVAFKAAISADPDYLDAYINLGAIHFEKKEYEAALKMFKTVTEKDPQNATAFANIGRVNYALKRWVEAEAAVSKAAELDADNPDLLAELGRVYYQRKNYPGLVKTMLKCHEMGGGDEDSYYLLGKGYQLQEKYPEAIKAFEQSIALADTYKAHSALGGIYLGQEKFSLARREFRAALKANPKAHRAAFNYAVAVQSADPDDYDASIAAWQDYVKLAKNNPRAKNYVAQAEQVIKDLKKAKQQSGLQ